MGALALALVLVGQIPRPTPAPAGVPLVAPWGAPLTWGDGPATRAAWLNPTLLAELSPSNDGAQAVKRLDPSARAICPRPAVCLWTVADAKAVLRALPAARFSPVLHDARSSRAAVRVPVGGVVVVLGAKVVNPGDWLSSRGLTVRRWLGADTVLVESAPGLEALELAGRLSREDGVELAAPDWWRPGTAK